MTRAEFYREALLAVIQPVTQAYILKHNLPFAEDEEDANENFDERQDEIESIVDMADNLAMKMTGRWEDSAEYFEQQELNNSEGA